MEGIGEKKKTAKKIIAILPIREYVYEKNFILGF